MVFGILISVFGFGFIFWLAWKTRTSKKAIQSAKEKAKEMLGYLWYFKGSSPVYGGTEIRITRIGKDFRAEFVPFRLTHMSEGLILNLQQGNIIEFIFHEQSIKGMCDDELCAYLEVKKVNPAA